MNESNTPTPQGLRYPKAMLWDTQWTNVVNHMRAYDGWTVEDAVHHAVQMTENYIRQNIERGEIPADLRSSLEPRPSETSRCWHPENCNTQKACMAQQKCLAASPSGGAAGGFANGLGISEGIYDHRIMVDRVIVTDWPDAHIVRFKSGAQRFDIGDAWETRDEADAYARLFNAALRNDDLNRRRNANVGWSDLAFLRWVAVDPGYNDEQRAMLERCAAALIGMFPPRLDRDDGARQQGES